MRGDSIEVVTFELGLQVGIRLEVKRREKGILSRRLGTKKTGRDEGVDWVPGKAHSQCVRIEHDCRGMQERAEDLYFLLET